MSDFCPKCGLIHSFKEWGYDNCPRCKMSKQANERIVFAGLPQYAIMTDSDNEGYCVGCGEITTWEKHFMSICEDCLESIAVS